MKEKQHLVVSAHCASPVSLAYVHSLLSTRSVLSFSFAASQLGHALCMCNNLQPELYKLQWWCMLGHQQMLYLYLCAPVLGDSRRLRRLRWRLGGFLAKIAPVTPCVVVCVLLVQYAPQLVQTPLL